MKALEGSSGQKAVNQSKRLDVIFGGTSYEPQVQSLLEAGRRMADSTGRNFSGTSGATEVMQIPGLLGKVAEGAKAAAGALGPLYGLRGVANASAAPINQRALPMLSRPMLPARVGQVALPGSAAQVPWWLGQPAGREEK